MILIGFTKYFTRKHKVLVVHGISLFLIDLTALKRNLKNNVWLNLKIAKLKVTKANIRRESFDGVNTRPMTERKLFQKIVQKYGT